MRRPGSGFAAWRDSSTDKLCALLATRSSRLHPWDPSLFPSCPRKRAPKAADTSSAALDPRFRGGDGEER
jgi:hypothetical protein